MSGDEFIATLVFNKMEKEGLSHKDIADMLEQTEKNIQKIEKKQRTFSTDNLFILIKLLWKGGTSYNIDHLSLYIKLEMINK